MENESNTSWWLKAIQTGLIGGVVALLVCLIGMVESFHQRDIIAGQITMGQTLLLLIVGLFAYFSSRGDENTPLSKRLTSGVLTGVITSAMVAGLVLLGHAVNLRKILVNASPALYKILTFEMKDTNTALVYLLLAGVGIGLIFALVHIIPALWRRALTSGFLSVLLIAILQDLIRVTLSPFPGITKSISWMFGSRGQEGLTVNGAIAVLILVTALSYLSSTRGNALRSRINSLPAGTQKAVRWTSWVLIAAFLLIWPRLAGPILSEVSNSIGIYILMGLGLN